MPDGFLRNVIAVSYTHLVPRRRGSPYLCRNLSDLGIDGIKKPFEVSHDPANQKLFQPVCEPVGEKIHKRLP